MIATYQVIPFALLVGAIVLLWIDRRAASIAVALAVIAGLSTGVLQWLALIWVAGLVVIAECYARLVRKKALLPAKRVALTFAFAVVCLPFGLHVLPGFGALAAFTDVVLTPGAASYSLYFGFDKVVAGFVIVLICYEGLIRNRGDLRNGFHRAALPYLAVVAGLVLLSVLFGYLRFDPKWTRLFWPWALHNLFFTCLSEEAMFRGLIQRQLSIAWENKPHGIVWSILIASILFGVAHAGGGWTYVLLATVAGAGYGYIFHRTGRIEFSMLAHFSLNATHFLLFTYPKLA